MTSESGEYLGRQLMVDSIARGPVAVMLPAESFIAPLAGRLQVFSEGLPDGGSRVRAIDIEAGCVIDLFHSEQVVRSALLDRDGTALYFHAVATADRRALGVSRVDLETGDVEVVVEPLSPDDRYGITFGTLLRWSTDGAALAVQSCGQAICRTQVLDVATGEVETYAEDGHGELVGLDERRLFVFGGCGDVLPCALLEIDRESGRQTTLHGEAYGAELVVRDGETRLLIDTGSGIEEVTP